MSDLGRLVLGVMEGGKIKIGEVEVEVKLARRGKCRLLVVAPKEIIVSRIKDETLNAPIAQGLERPEVS